MANRIYHKRSAKGTDVPTTSDLELGELAINNYLLKKMMVVQVL
jgi:hypothetical protein